MPDDPKRNTADQRHRDVSVTLPAMDLSPTQIATLQTLHANGFQIVAFPMYASHIGIRRGKCAALLTPLGSGTFELFGAPGYMIGENIAVRIRDGSEEWFVWKQERIEATPERNAEIAAFASEISTALLPRA
ncbi:MAG: hypothetical protein WA823_01755 [Candidatus Acidiferrales bacterium]